MTAELWLDGLSPCDSAPRPRADAGAFDPLVRYTYKEVRIASDVRMLLDTFLELKLLTKQRRNSWLDRVADAVKVEDRLNGRQMMHEPVDEPEGFIMLLRRNAVGKA